MYYKLSLVSILITIGITSCSPLYYAPTSPNVPLFNEKGETQISGNINLTGKCVGVQAAYALSDKVGFMLNPSFFNYKNDSLGNGGSGVILEAGAGYYKKLTPNIIFETYGILAPGHLENHRPKEGNIQADFLKYGLQPAIGFRIKWVDIAYSLGISRLYYYTIQGNMIFDKENQVTYLKSHKDQFILEPTLTLRTGSENFKVQAQLLKSYNYSDPAFRQERGTLTIGVMYNFHPKREPNAPFYNSKPRAR